MGVTITVTDHTPEIFEALRQVFSGSSINQEAGREASQQVQQHFAEIEQDEEHHFHGGIGGERTHFYEQAGQRTSFTSDDSFATVTVAQEGIAQRYYGGPIDPIQKQWLTIPATDEAYGHRAGEFNLRFVLINESLAALFPKDEPRRRGQDSSGPYFWLVKHVDQAPDPTVLPEEEQLKNNIVVALREFVQSEIR